MRFIVDLCNVETNEMKLCLQIMIGGIGFHDLKSRVIMTMNTLAKKVLYTITRKYLN